MTIVGLRNDSTSTFSSGAPWARMRLVGWPLQLASMSESLRILFAGGGEFGLPTLKRLREMGHEIVLVISQPDRPAGRGRKTTPTPISHYALETGMPLDRTVDINQEKLPPADLLVVIAFGQKIAPQIVDHSRLGSVNLHASILPRYRGAAPINWAIIRGETMAGNSVIRLAQKMDAGEVLGQSRLEVGELETAGELHDRLASDGAGLVARVVGELAAGTAVAVEQDHSQATLAPKIGRQETVLDFAGSPADALGQRIRGLYPSPGCRAQLLDAAGVVQSRVTLVRARAAAGEGPRWKPGELTSHGAISVGDGTHAVEIIELQPEGRTPMPLQAYRNGHPWMPGMRVESIA